MVRWVGWWLAALGRGAACLLWNAAGWWVARATRRDGALPEHGLVENFIPTPLSQSLMRQASDSESTALLALPANRFQ